MAENDPHVRLPDGSYVDPAFIGRGITFPMGVDHTGSISLTSGPEDLDRSIRVVLATAPGERVMRPEFGCRIWELLFEPVNSNTLGLMAQAVRQAVAQWEPRVEVEDVGRHARRARERHGAHRGDLSSAHDERSSQPRLPVLRHTSRGKLKWHYPLLIWTIVDSRTSSTRPSASFPGTALSGPTQLVRPGRCAHRAVRVDERDDYVPAQPGTRSVLREVPRARRHRAVPAVGGARTDLTFWLSTVLDHEVSVPAGTAVATAGAAEGEEVVSPRSKNS